MFSFSPRRFHSVLIGPALLPLLLLCSSKNPDNQPPVAVDDSFTIHCCSLINVTANDSDPDNEVFFISDFPTRPAHGTISNNGNGNVFFMATTGYVGTDSFTYQICDPQHACATATVTLNISVSSWLTTQIPTVMA
ncbi:MAG: hypothetical protein DMF73_17915 [Acidobacteria bacterium]|nr:MAG: hypothetical protein DMF73_17915 [Acidobacteriota bacterium]